MGHLENQIKMAQSILMFKTPKSGNKTISKIIFSTFYLNSQGLSWWRICSRRTLCSLGSLPVLLSSCPGMSTTWGQGPEPGGVIEGHCQHNTLEPGFFNHSCVCFHQNIVGKVNKVGEFRIERLHCYVNYQNTDKQFRYLKSLPLAITWLTEER